MRPLLRQLVWRAFSRAFANTGNRIAAKMAMIAITTNNSIRVKPLCLRILRHLSHGLGTPDTEPWFLGVECLPSPSSLFSGKAQGGITTQVR